MTHLEYHQLGMIAIRIRQLIYDYPNSDLVKQEEYDNAIYSICEELEKMAEDNLEAQLESRSHPHEALVIGYHFGKRVAERKKGR